MSLLERPLTKSIHNFRDGCSTITIWEKTLDTSKLTRLFTVINGEGDEHNIKFEGMYSRVNVIFSTVSRRVSLVYDDVAKTYRSKVVNVVI